MMIPALLEKSIDRPRPAAEAIGGGLEGRATQSRVFSLFVGLPPTPRQQRSCRRLNATVGQRQLPGGEPACYVASADAETPDFALFREYVEAAGTERNTNPYWRRNIGL